MAQTNMFSLGSALSQPETSPVYYWKDFGKFFYPGAKAYKDFVKNEQPALYDQFKMDYLGGRDKALENAQIYSDYAKGLFQNQPNQFGDYRQVGDYLYGKLSDFSGDLMKANTRDMNSRLAALGLSPGRSGYANLQNAQRITNNLVPAFNTVTGAVGRDYGNISNNAFRDTMLRLGLAQDDTLTGYYDNVYRRPLDVSDMRMGQLAQNNAFYRDLVNNYRSNVGGFKTEETSDWAKGIGVVDNLLNGVVDLYTSYMGGGGTGGLGGMFGGMFGGGQGQPQPSSNPYMDYLGAAGQRVNNQGINPYSFSPGGYMGDINVNPYTMGAV